MVEHLVQYICKYKKYSQRRYFCYFLYYIYVQNKIVLRSQEPMLNDGTFLTWNITQTFFV
jgi:hypothetical protein